MEKLTARHLIQRKSSWSNTSAGVLPVFKIAYITLAHKCSAVIGLRSAYDSDCGGILKDVWDEILRFGMQERTPWICHLTRQCYSARLMKIRRIRSNSGMWEGLQENCCLFCGRVCKQSRDAPCKYHNFTKDIIIAGAPK